MEENEDDDLFGVEDDNEEGNKENSEENGDSDSDLF